MSNKNKNWWGRNSSSSDSESKNNNYKSSFFDWDKWTGGKNYNYTPPVKKQIVKPYISYFDAGKIVRGVHGDQEFINHIADNKLALLIHGKPYPDSQIRSKAQDLYKDMIPDHLIEDIYSLYYNKSSDIEFAELKDSNEVKFKILEKINNSLLKIVSNNNSIASFMYTKEISHFLMSELLDQLTPEQQQQLQDSMKDCNKGEAKSKDKKDKDDESNNSGEGDSSGKGNQGKGKGSNKKKGKSDKNSEETSEDKNDSETDSNEEGEDDDESGDENSESGDSGEDTSDDEDNGEDNGNESDDESSENSQSGVNQANNSKGSSKSGHRENPLGGHNSKEDTSGVKDWKKKNAEKELSKEEVLAQTIERIFNKPDVKQRFDQAIMKADQLMSDLEKAGIDLKEDGLGQIAEIANLKQVRSDIHALTMNKRAIVEAVKQILDNSKNYFSKKYKLKEIDLLEADEIEEIYGMEYIHPVFQGLMLDRLSTEERKYLGKIDLFIDISGSMGSGSGIPGVSNILFAKSIALAMLNMDLLNNLYTFDTRVTKIEATELNILMIGFGGGTSIETVVQHVVNKSKNNAICLTDGEDSVQTYDERMFFMGTIGVMFSYFSHPSYGGKQDSNGDTAGMKYIKSGQCINFDGQKSTLITPKLLKEKKAWYGE